MTVSLCHGCQQLTRDNRLCEPCATRGWLSGYLYHAMLLAAEEAHLDGKREREAIAERKADEHYREAMRLDEAYFASIDNQQETHR